MKNLLLPYAYDSTGNLVHINDARKDDSYKCPECGQPLTLNISKIPEGQKYHRRNHFSHPKGNPDNHCTESFLHKLFKERAVDCILKKISENEEFWFTWHCDQCNEVHRRNILRKAKSVCLEYNLKNCQPDIALLDTEDKVVIVIEVVVTHKPTPEAMAFYKDHNIGCLQINVSDFEDCEHVEEKLAHPDIVNLCPTPNCEKCGYKKHKVKMIVGEDLCWRCGKITEVAIIKDLQQKSTYTPLNFTKEEISLANKNGAHVENKFFRKEIETLNVNVCKHCGMSGKRFLHNDYLPINIIKELDIYRCNKCIESEKQNKVNTKQKKDEIIYAEGMICPKCQCELILKQGPYGKFYACGNYPNCRYTEKFLLKD